MDCISLQKATDNPCAWNERLSLNTANRLSVFLKVADIPPRTSIARGTNVIPIFAQLLSWRQHLLSSAASSAYTAFVAALVRVGLQRRSNSYIKCSRFPRFPSRDKDVYGARLVFWNEVPFSNTGERFADEQANTILSRIRSSLAIATPGP